MNAGQKAFLKLEVKMLFIAVAPSVIYVFTSGVSQAVKVLLVCFLVPQPFLIYAFKEWLWRDKDGEQIVPVTHDVEMNNKDEVDSLSERLERALQITSDVHVPPGVNPHEYLAGLIADIRAHRCLPHVLSAVVMGPGFPDKKPGEIVTGICVASHRGYWLVYDHESDGFYAFWGEDPNSLGAHGVFGSPLYCWSA